MAITVLGTPQSTQFGGSGGTTSSVDTTGANLLVVILCYNKAGSANLSDSKSNTWTQLTKYESSTGNSGVVIYYVSSPTVGTGHTLTTTSTFCGVNFVWMSGARTATTPFDQQNGTAGGTSANPQAPGSITPTVNNCIVFTGFYQRVAGSAPTIPTGYTSIGTWPTSTAFLGGAAYKIQTSASAENPGWTPGNAGTDFAVNIADFMPPAAANPNSNFFLVLPC